MRMRLPFGLRPPSVGPGLALPPGVMGILTARRGTRYVLVGGFNTGFGLALFAGLQYLLGARLTYIGVLFVTHIVSVLVAFSLYRWYVFRVRGHLVRDLLRFWSVYLAGLGVNVVLLPFGVEVLGLPPTPVQAVIFIGTPLLTYVAHARFSFHRGSRQADSGPPPEDGTRQWRDLTFPSPAGYDPTDGG